MLYIYFYSLPWTCTLYLAIYVISWYLFWYRRTVCCFVYIGSAIKFLSTGQPGEYEMMEGETEMTTGEEVPLPASQEDKDISVIAVSANQNVINTEATNEDAVEPVAV